FHHRADLAVRPRTHRTRAEYELGRRYRLDIAAAARRLTLSLHGALPILAGAGLVEREGGETRYPVRRRDGRRPTEGATARVVAERHRDGPGEARHRIPRRIERGDLDRRADRRARHRVGRLDGEGQPRGGARGDVERGTRRG